MQVRERILATPISLVAGVVPAEQPRISSPSDAERAQIREAVAGRIQQAVSLPDPAAANLETTQLHRELGEALSHFIGEGSGRNFHSWATMASDSVGRSIRQEAIPWLRTLSRSGVPLLGGAAGKFLDEQTTNFSKGNRFILQESAQATLRFLSELGADQSRDFARATAFAETLESEAESKGRSAAAFLGYAYRFYYEARFADSMSARSQLTLGGNLALALYEQLNLQPDLEEMMSLHAPRAIDPLADSVLRRLLTRFVGKVDVGGEEIRTGRDVPRSSSTEVKRLDEDAVAALFEALTHLGSSTSERTAARDWTSIPERMRFIATMMRTYHLNGP